MTEPVGAILRPALLFPGRCSDWCEPPGRGTCGFTPSRPDLRLLRFEPHPGAVFLHGHDEGGRRAFACHRVARAPCGCEKQEDRNGTPGLRIVFISRLDRVPRVTVQGGDGRRAARDCTPSRTDSMRVVCDQEPAAHPSCQPTLVRPMRMRARTPTGRRPGRSDTHEDREIDRTRCR